MPEFGVSVRLRVPEAFMSFAPVLPFVAGVPIPCATPAAPVPGVFVAAFARLPAAALFLFPACACLWCTVFELRPETVSAVANTVIRIPVRLMIVRRYKAQWNGEPNPANC